MRSEAFAAASFGLKARIHVSVSSSVETNVAISCESTSTCFRLKLNLVLSYCPEPGLANHRVLMRDGIQKSHPETAEFSLPLTAFIVALRWRSRNSLT